MSILISVVVCTYNRADLLKNVLTDLCGQTLEPGQYEIVVVDNNSTDNTRSIAQQFCEQYPHVRYCFEPQQGLSYARNRGWQEAVGQYVAYTDDDCQIPEQWLSIAKEIIEAVNPPVFGGPYFAFYNTSKPRWFRDEYGSFSLGGEARFLEQDYIHAGNLFLQRHLLANLGGFDPRLGMSGNKIAYGEETELLKRVYQTIGSQAVYYRPDLYVYHLVGRQKMLVLDHLRRRFVTGSCQSTIHASIDNFSFRKELSVVQHLLTVLINLGVILPIRLLLRDRRRFPYLENFLYETTASHTYQLGTLYSYYREKLARQKFISKRFGNGVITRLF